MKAILVIDMPTSCSICKADKICKVWNEEQVKFKGYNDRIDGCPLKPMPEKYIVHDITIETERDAAVCSHGITLGHNYVIEEIEG